MGKFLKVTLHGLYLLFFFLIVLFVVTMFANIASGAPHPLNQANIQLILLLIVWWLAVYIFQMRKQSWTRLLIGTIIYLAVTAFVLMVVYPYMF